MQEAVLVSPAPRRPVGFRDGRGTRASILEAVRSQPGIHKSLICRSVGLSWGTVGYHIRILQRLDLVHLSRTGSRVHVLPTGQSRPSTLPAMERQILQLLLAKPFAGRAELRRGVGMGSKAINRALGALVDLGLVVTNNAYHPAYGIAHARRDEVFELVQENGLEEGKKGSLPI